MRGFNAIALLMLLEAGAICAAVQGEPWFSPPGGTWAPDASVVSVMKSDLGEAIAPLLAKQAPPSALPTRYWFQYRGQGTSSNRIIVVLGYPFPVPRGAEKDFFSVHIPEACAVFALYLPSERKFDWLEVGPNCPPRI